LPIEDNSIDRIVMDIGIGDKPYLEEFGAPEVVAELREEGEGRVQPQAGGVPVGRGSMGTLKKNRRKRRNEYFAKWGAGAVPGPEYGDPNRIEPTSPLKKGGHQWDEEIPGLLQ